MAHFRGTIQGGRGEASRLGHKSTGVTVRAQSWGWDVETIAFHDEASGHDYASVQLVHHKTGERRHVAFLDLTTGEERKAD